MSFISFLPLNKKTNILLSFISISFIASIIPGYFNVIIPFQIDLIDYSSQILIGLPFLLQILFNKNKEYQLLSKFSKKDYIIFILIMILDLLQATLYVVYDHTLTFLTN